MRRAAIVIVVGMALTAAGPARAFPGHLTKDQFVAAQKAARAKLPPVDEAMVATCKAQEQGAYDADHKARSATELNAVARCYRKAGALGLAIQAWKVLLQTFYKQGYIENLEIKPALRELGSAYEAAADYDEAAQQYRTYATRYSAEPDAADKLIRAICIWSQLGDDDDAKKAFQDLGKLRRGKVQDDPDTMCDAVHAIVVPDTTP